MRHKKRAGGTTGTATSTSSAADSLMVGGWEYSYTSKPLRYALVAIAFTVDMLLHIAVGVAVWYTFDHSPEPPWNPIMSGVFAGLAASFVHRTFVQRLIRTTLGKVIFGLRLRRQDGTYPTLWALVKQWFSGTFAALEVVTSLG